MALPPSDSSRGERPEQERFEQRFAAADVDIPVLTDVVQIAGLDADAFAPRPGASATADLERRVTEDVLQRLSRRTDALLDERLQATLMPVLQRAAEAVARELHRELHEAIEPMIRDLVARMVADELTRLRAQATEGNRTARPTR